MPRPGFVLEVDDKTPPLLTMAGASVKLEGFGIGTRVAYPADAAPSSDPVALIDAALDTPAGGAPLAQRLGQDVRLTIVVTDSGEPLPKMRFDVRRTMVERVLELAARHKVDDVQVVIATGLNRRWVARDVTQVLGDRVATSFMPEGHVTSHDVTGDDLVVIGELDGHEVKLNARVASSDLVISVGVRADHVPGHPFARHTCEYIEVYPGRLYHQDISPLGRIQLRLHDRLAGIPGIDLVCRPVAKREP